MTSRPSGSALLVAGTAASILLTEIVLTRLFSVLLFYHFSFLAVGLALFGLAMGGLIAARKPLGDDLQLFERRIRSRLFGAAGSLLGIVLVLVLVPPLESDLMSALGLAILSGVPLVLLGEVLARALAVGREEIHRLYSFDLLASAGAALAAIPLMQRIQGPIILAVPALAALLLARRVSTPRWRVGASALAAALAVLVAAMLYAVLRRLEVPWIHAWMIAALTLVYPWFDSIRLWATADQVSLSVCLALAGLWLALVGIARDSWRWHFGAALLYLLSILTYEITLPFVASAGLLYVLRFGWRAGRSRWAVDLIVAIVTAAWVAAHTARTTSGPSGNVTHLKSIVTSGGTLLGRTLQPLGEQRTTIALIVFAVTLLAGAFAFRRFSPRFSGDSGWGLRDWLLLTVGGLVLAAVGWAIFVPADPYYTPSIYGITNRVNGLAGIGLVIATYGTLGIIGALVGRLRSRARALALVTTVSLGVLLGIAYTDVLRRHIAIWNSAYVSESVALTKLKARFPTLPPRTTLFVAGYPAYQTLGVPILSANWDVDGMVQVEYDDSTLSAFPVLKGTKVVCRPDGVGLSGTGAPASTAPYGDARLIDLSTGAWSEPRSRRQCRSVAARYVPGPLYLSFDY